MPLSDQLKNEWSAALRSGNYKQCTLTLRRNEVDGVHHCCLGVLCEIAGLPTYDPEAKNDFLDGGYTFLEETLGMTEDEKVSFWKLNDFNGYTFAQIADVIDEGTIV